MDQLKLPIAIYARYSSDLQNERSCEDQVSECKQYIERQDDLRGRPIEIFTDNAISGSFITNGPSMVRLMEAIKQQKISAIVSESLDRISPNLSETDEILRLCAYYGIPIFTVMEAIEQQKIAAIVSESLDRISRSLSETDEISRLCTYYDRPISTVMEGIIQRIHVGLSGTVNSIFIEQVAHRVKRGQAGNIRQGKAANGPPYGYKVKYLNDQGVPEKGLREIYPEQAKIVQRIYDEFCSGKTIVEIVTSLNNEGIPSSRGGKWRRPTVLGCLERGEGILQNTMYKGQLVWNRHNRAKHPITGLRHTHPNPKDTWIYHTCEDLRIISDKQWNKVQHLIQKSRAPQSRPRKNHAPLEFDIYCSQCGDKTTGNGFNYVICSNYSYTGTCTQTRKININKARRAIYEQIALDPSTLWDEWRAHLLELGKDKQDQINKAKKECEEYHGHIDRLTEDLSVGGCTADSFHKHVTKNQSDLEKAEKKLASLQSLPSLATMNKRKFKTLIKAWTHEHEEFVDLLTASVTVGVSIDGTYAIQELIPDYHGLAKILKCSNKAHAS